MANKIHIKNMVSNNAVVNRIEGILKRKILEKSGKGIAFIGKNNCDIEIQLCLSPSIGEEGYMIESLESGVKITGHDQRGLLYGVGKLLSISYYSKGEFKAGDWRGKSLPDKKVRGMYFATHFYNYYHCAPLDEIRCYIEDIALWGLNTIAVWYDMHHFNGINDPSAVDMIKRLKSIFKAAKDIGLMTAYLGLGNEGYANSPVEMRAEWTPGKNGKYPDGLGSHYHVELCPNKPGAIELMLQWKKEALEVFSEVGVDFVCFGPYDQGGCTCDECSPWGGNGFVKIFKESSRLARQCIPGVKVVFSAWLIEYFIEGEWEKISEAITEDPYWVDYIMWDYNTTGRAGTGFILDPYLARNGAPGGVPLIGFPEISMFATKPYGGWGANPQIDYLEVLWEKTGPIFNGGFPYSEGKYEDFNKAICAQLYWDENKKASEAAREYIAYEFSQEYADDILKAAKMMQSTYVRRARDENYNMMERNKPYGENARFIIDKPENIREIYEIMSKVDEKLDEITKNSWRWRVLYLRSIIDYELANNNYSISDRCEEALTELERMYYAEHAATSLAPQTRRARKIFKAQ